jgi:hypothetical protein
MFIEFTIGNSGPTIPSTDVEKLFSAFFTKGKRGGTGLGLAIAQKIVNSHGGKIRCSSSNEHGTCFVFTIPMLEAPSHDSSDEFPTHSRLFHEPASNISSHAAENLALKTLSPSPSPPAGRVTVALIEDDIFLREAWQKELCDDCDLDVFSSGEAFLAASSSSPTFLSKYSLLISDYYFEGESVTGATIAKHIAERISFPIVLCSDSELPSDELTLFSGRIAKSPQNWVSLRDRFLK